MSIQRPIVRCVVVGIDHFEDLTRPFVSALVKHNPDLDVVLIDNHSSPCYPSDDNYWTVRTERCGYGQALNIGADFDDGERPYWDWLLCCNNDCLCSAGGIAEIISKLQPDTVYGNNWKVPFNDPASGLPEVADSAYFLISRQIWQVIGGYDPEMDAAFEEIDYQIRAVRAGFHVSVAPLPITHLDLHTRYETPDYEKRWEKTQKVFLERYMKYERQACSNCHYVSGTWICPQCGHNDMPAL